MRTKFNLSRLDIECVLTSIMVNHTDPFTDDIPGATDWDGVMSDIIDYIMGLTDETID